MFLAFQMAVNAMRPPRYVIRPGQQPRAVSVEQLKPSGVISVQQCTAKFSELCLEKTNCDLHLEQCCPQSE